MKQRITDDEFDTAQQEVDRRLRAAASADLATRAAFDAFNADWEQLVAACSARRADDRERADVAIRVFAVEHGLIRDAALAASTDPERLLAGLPSGDAAAIRQVVGRCIASRTWRSECDKEARTYTIAGNQRKQVEQYVRARYDAAGAGFSGRWQG